MYSFSKFVVDVACLIATDSKKAETFKSTMRINIAKFFCRRREDLD